MVLRPIPPIVMVILLVACSKPVPYPEIHYEKSNEKYLLRVTPSEGIGQVKKVSVNVMYVVLNNRACIPIDYTLAPGGIHPQPGKSYYLIARVIDGEILVEIPASIARDENYYGLGVCRWGVKQITVNSYAERGRIGFVIGRNEIANIRHIQYCRFESGMCVLDRLTTEGSEIRKKKQSFSIEITKE